MRIDPNSSVSPAGVGAVEGTKTHRRRDPPSPGEGVRHAAREAVARKTAEPPPPPEQPQHSLSIRIDHNKQIFYQVIDEKTGQVVRQIPPEEVRRAGRHIAELLRSQEAQERHRVDVSS
jgi:hypothetical protein